MQDNFKAGATREQREKMLEAQGLPKSTIKLCLDAQETSDEYETNRTPIDLPIIKEATLVPRPAETDDRRKDAFFGGTTIKPLKI